MRALEGRPALGVRHAAEHAVELGREVRGETCEVRGERCDR